MLKLSNVNFYRGDRQLLDAANLHIHTQQKVGITGANGVGKSSLFSIIQGDCDVDGGDVFIRPNIKIAHVAQETPAVETAAIEYVLDGDQELRHIEHQLKLAEQNNDSNTQAKLLMQYENIGGYSANARAASLMSGLGFLNEQEQASVKQLSGGWRMRLNLAQALMCRSDLLLLDEPTNHLDLDAVIWLENWLSDYKGTLLLISHDRDFLDRITTHIANMEQKKIDLYSGNFSAFEQRVAEQLAVQQAAYEKQQKQIKHMNDFITRFKAKASKAKQAQSRVKALERMSLIGAAYVTSNLSFKFSPVGRIASPLMQLKNIDLAYADNVVLSDINLSIEAKDRIALIGPNGAGKSTLIKLLIGKLQQKRGDLESAKDLRFGYFAQHQLEQLDLLASPLVLLQRLDKHVSEKECRNFLGSFGFIGDIALNPIQHFSGGEKARLVLALLVFQKPNILLLDEPTNHLDMQTRHALTVALQEYEGALVLVSHDRFLLRTTTDKVLLVNNGQVDEFSNSIDEYGNWLKKNTPTKSNANGESTINSRKQQRQQNAEIRKKLQPLKQKLNKLEQTIEQLNRNKSLIESQLADASIYDATEKDRLKRVLSQQSGIKQQLDEHEEQWMLIMEEYELAQQMIANSE